MTGRTVPAPVAAPVAFDPAAHGFVFDPVDGVWRYPLATRDARAIPGWSPADAITDDSWTMPRRIKSAR